MSRRITSRSERRRVVEYRYLQDCRRRGQRRVVTFWGQQHSVEPAVHRFRYGDGRAWLFLYPLNQRPDHYLVRIDSSWLVDDIDGNEFRDLIDVIVEDLCLEFNECGQDDGCIDGTCSCVFPVGSWDNGCSWRVEDDKRASTSRRSRQRAERKHRRKRARRQGWRPGR